MREDSNYTVSHDSKNAPQYTHRTKFVKSPYFGEIVGIIDDEKKHYHFLKAWSNMVIDINNQWSVNNGVMALDIELHKDGKNKVSYMVKLSSQMVVNILKTRANAIAICDEARNILLYIMPLKVDQLLEFYMMKKETDDYIKKNNLHTRGWILD